MTIRGHGSPARLQPVLWSGQRPCFASDAGRQVSAGHAVRRRDGRLFRSLSRGELGEALDPSHIPRIDKAMARRAGIEAELAERLSGQSIRVGAAQDMVAHGIELLAIQQAGRGGAAQLARMQGRDRPIARRGPPAPADPAAPPPGGGGITELGARLLDEGAHELRAAVAAPAPDPLEQRFMRVSRLLARALGTMHLSLAISR